MSWAIFHAYRFRCFCDITDNVRSIIKVRSSLLTAGMIQMILPHLLLIWTHKGVQAPAFVYTCRGNPGNLTRWNTSTSNSSITPGFAWKGGLQQDSYVLEHSQQGMLKQRTGFWQKDIQQHILTAKEVPHQHRSPSSSCSIRGLSLVS